MKLRLIAFLSFLIFLNHRVLAQSQDLVLADSFVLSASDTQDHDPIIPWSYLEYRGPFQTLFARIFQTVPRYLGTSQTWISYLSQYKGASNTHFAIIRSFDKPLELVKRAKSSLTGPIDKIYLNFSLAPLCAVHAELVDDDSRFEAKVESLLSYIDKHLEYNQLYWVEPFSVVQIRLDSDIAQKQLKDGSGTCSDFYKSPTPGQDWSADPTGALEIWLPRMFCRSYYFSSPEQLSRFANRIRSYREKIEQVIEKSREKNSRVHRIQTPRHHLFLPDDIADDCLHLNQHGHTRIALSINEELQSNL